MKECFINQSLEISIKSYLESKDHKEGIIYNSFQVVFIRTLIILYNELDIINPYLIKNPELLVENLSKYGYSRENVINLFNELTLFNINEKNKVVPNPSFVKLEKMLIDMYINKKVNYNVTTDEEYEFKQILYSPFSSNELIISYNYLHTKNELEILKYFDDKNNTNHKIYIEKPKKLLAPEAYKTIDKNYTDIALLSADEIENINDLVYSKFHLNKTAVNFEYLFERAIYNHYHKNDKITSGNGYVDILLILSIICTLAMLIIIATIIF